ncbi:hypothetical protein XAP3CFBP6996_017685 [Xanthomonas citri pv. fuscans CFBP 6996]|uniref:hypothetical protein n=1 Tax=Xanthomonas citri TaxID=346 RepID=UPI000C1742BB|nr:hypothetical protein [Xanthomonas citri]ATS52230.1 hypothetical protein XcfCFBP6992P_16245 [Xanthomonas citri pv. phaseoli var. fuscans]ATS54116.1 hypothetical protein XcfCFBP6994P_02135 [Xanthomonas citri pv. phaseoli var. fuscans]ATS58149.1 hypothetical protein XcfCFBP6996P_01450 [Xanthomonas citri pv. phaseoli var. fuscans]PTY29542.1 hypothetical protein XAP3CFBP6996_017685 [Xanthomonas citri pv. fuscans CFBP 6996]QWN16828.1 hypothetical protein DGN02_14205 [Xanthomonas citri]
MAPALTGAIFFRAGTQRICFFDKDRGAEVFVRACGGNYLALENGSPTGFNPFQCRRPPNFDQRLAISQQ